MKTYKNNIRLVKTCENPTTGKILEYNVAYYTLCMPKTYYPWNVPQRVKDFVKWGHVISQATNTFKITVYSK